MEQVEVKQIDRDGAARAFRDLNLGACEARVGQHFAEMVRAGHEDDHPFVQAFARHRLSAESRQSPLTPKVEEGDEYMTVTLSRDGLVQSHNAYDADFDEMVRATETIIRVLQERLSNRKYCPYSHGGSLKHGTLTTPAKVEEGVERDKLRRRIAAARMLLGMQLQARYVDRDGDWSIFGLFNDLEALLAAFPSGERDAGLEDGHD